MTKVLWIVSPHPTQNRQAFHALYKGLCDAAGAGPREAGGLGLYSEFKKTCDDYFYLPARKEHRGVGGIFFDDLERLDLEPSDNGAAGGGVRRAKAFTEAVGRAFMPSYLPSALACAPGVGEGWRVWLN